MERGDMVIVSGQRVSTLGGVCMVLNLAPSGKAALVADEFGNEEHIELKDLSLCEGESSSSGKARYVSNDHALHIGNLPGIRRGGTRKAYLKMAFEAGHLDAESGAAPASPYHQRTQMHKAYQEGYKAGLALMKMLSNAGIPTL